MSETNVDTTTTAIETTDLQALLTLATKAATAAGDMLVTRFRNPDPLEISHKDDGVNNLVTEMDTAAEELIREILSERDDIIFLGEETGGNHDLSKPTWVVDPIDGTVNYAHGLPIWCISIAVVQNNEPIVGVIHNPNMNETFTAIKGGGAFLNGKRLHVSNESNLRSSLLVTGFPYNINENPHGTIDLFGAVLRHGIAVRRLGSAALDLAYIAAGRFEGYWEVTLNPWDVAAGILLLNEAGGSLSSYAPEGEPHTAAPTREIVVERILATNGKIHEELLGLLRE